MSWKRRTPAANRRRRHRNEQRAHELVRAWVVLPPFVAHKLQRSLRKTVKRLRARARARLLERTKVEARLIAKPWSFECHRCGGTVNASNMAYHVAPPGALAPCQEQWSARITF